MARRRSDPRTRWQRVAFAAAAAYAVLFWVLPIVTMVPFGVLPWVHGYSFLERLLASAAGSALCLALLFAGNAGRVSLRMGREGSLRDAIVGWGSVVAGFALASAGTAALGGNLAALAARLLPGEPQRLDARIDWAHATAGRRGVTMLAFTAPGINGTRYVWLSRRRFGTLGVVAGDRLELAARRTAAGLYVSGVARRRADHVTGGDP